MIAQDAEGAPRIANPIYAEVVPRHLNAAVQAGLPHERAWYVGADGALDVEGLIADCQTFFREALGALGAALRAVSGSRSRSSCSRRTCSGW